MRTFLAGMVFAFGLVGMMSTADFEDTKDAKGICQVMTTSVMQTTQRCLQGQVMVGTRQDYILCANLVVTCN